VNRYHGFIVCIVLCSIIVAPLSAQTLEDQFGKSRDIGAELSTGNLILVWSDRRDAPADLAAWCKALEEAAPGTKLVAVADLKSVPFFVSKSTIIKGVVQDEPTRSFVLDWKGEISARLGFERGGPVVLIIGPGSVIRTRTKGLPTPEAVAAIIAASR